MAVYEANMRSLAEFISETKLSFNPFSVKSTEGYRQDGPRSRYEISAKKITCDKINIVNDCFIDIDGNITITSYIPGFSYSLITNELSEYYKSGDSLGFKFKVDSFVLKQKVTNKDIKLESYNDFEKCLNNLIEDIKEELQNKINEFKYSSWKIEGVCCSIQWQIDKIKRD